MLSKNRRKSTSELERNSLNLIKVFDDTIKGLVKISTDARQEASDRRELAQQHLTESESLEKLAKINDKRVAKLSEIVNVVDEVEEPVEETVEQTTEGE